MSICEGEKGGVLPLLLMSFLYLKAFSLERITVVREGMSIGVMGIIWVTFKNDVMRISKSVEVIIGSE